MLARCPKDPTHDEFVTEETTEQRLTRLKDVLDQEDRFNLNYHFLTLDEGEIRQFRQMLNGEQVAKVNRALLEMIHRKDTTLEQERPQDTELGRSIRGFMTD